MRLRVIDLGSASASRAHALYHGLADAYRRGDPPILALVRADEPHISIGFNQDLAGSIDTAYCRQARLPIIRRRLGGGAVYIDGNQLFFHLIVGAGRPERLLALIARPVVQTYAGFGIAARHRPPGDITVGDITVGDTTVGDMTAGERKLGAIAGGEIGQALTAIGSFLFDFDHQAMAGALKAPSAAYRARLEAALEASLATLNTLMATPPDFAEVKRRFIAETAGCFGLEAAFDQPTDMEWAAIQAAAHALADPEYLAGRERRHAASTVKLAEGATLGQAEVETEAGPLGAVLFEREGRIAELQITGRLDGVSAPGQQALARRLRGAGLDAVPLRCALAEAKRVLGLALAPVDLERVAGCIEAARYTRW
jgi:lipoate-protein ligase A